MLSANPDTDATLIPADSERQAMDWGLVLASQEIPATIQRHGDTWHLAVPLAAQDQALEAICLFQSENRTSRWQRQVPVAEAPFHLGAFFPVVLLAWLYRLSNVDLPAIESLWILRSEAVLTGQWWLVFSAMLLHADLPHLMLNLTTGLLLLGLAMARHGAGVALLGCYLAGAAGNVLGLAFHSQPYQGLGASGFIMGALGLITIPNLSAGWRDRSAIKQLLRGLLGGLMLFVLLGLSPNSDVVAHLGGFSAGILQGLILARLPGPRLRSPAMEASSWLVLIPLLLLTSWLGLVGG